MSATELSLVRSITEKGILEFLREVESAISLGFNVRIVFICKHNKDVLFKVTESILKSKKRIYNLVINDSMEKHGCENAAIGERKTLVLEYDGFEKNFGCLGFVTFNFPSFLDLLPSISMCIEKVLKCFGLLTYLNSFSPAHRQSLRKILVNRSFEIFLDTVVQIAFFEGVRGEAFSVDRLREAPSANKESGSSTVPTGAQLALVLNWALDSSPDPYMLMKALLSFYVTEVQKLPHSEASKRLDLSRSTLQIHLKSARELKVDHLFEQCFTKTAAQVFQKTTC